MDIKAKIEEIVEKIKSDKKLGEKLNKQGGFDKILKKIQLL